ncbi:MAG: dihydroorotate dehydrogenase [Candidatus Diapherotrites archaeon]|nr:dihydroorotate dehydrogenase [Candidatus Diapherotrites archaeon]
MLETEFCKVKLGNPTVLASGILGTSAELLIRAAENGAGAVTIKSIGPREREGHNNPTIFEWEHGLINAVGLSSEGYKEMEDVWEALKKCPVPVIASIYGANVQEFIEVAENVAKQKPAIVEANISCPNSEKHGQVFGCNIDASAEVISAVKKAVGEIPLIAKLTPQAPNIAEIAKACEAAGADAICAINTVAGMVINIEARKPVLHFKKGGLSGPAVKPVAVKCIWEIYEAVKIPILGVGGVSSGRDAIELMQAGASAIGIGSGVHFKGIDVFKKVCSEMEEWMNENGFANVKELVGIAHE